MNKWDELRSLIEATLSHNVQYSHDKAYDRYSYRRVLEWMDLLDKNEKEKPRMSEAPKEGFLYTGVPAFDQKAWDKIMEEKGLQGLS